MIDVLCITITECNPHFCWQSLIIIPYLLKSIKGHQSLHIWAENCLHSQRKNVMYFPNFMLKKIPIIYILISRDCMPQNQISKAIQK